MHTQPNGPREQKSTGRLRHTLTNTASKQDASKVGRVSYGRHTRPQNKTTKFQNDQRLQKLADKIVAPTATSAPSVVSPTPPQRQDQTQTLMMLATAIGQGKTVGGGKGNFAGIKGGGTPQANIQLGRQLAKEYGWTNEQWRALRQLWQRESGWRTRAANPESSARGIPQAMASVHFGDDWRSDPAFRKFFRNPKRQIRWGLNYIKGRYGDPLSALRFHNRKGYY